MVQKYVNLIHTLISFIHSVAILVYVITWGGKLNTVTYNLDINIGVIFNISNCSQCRLD